MDLVSVYFLGSSLSLSMYLFFDSIVEQSTMICKKIHNKLYDLIDYIDKLSKKDGFYSISHTKDLCKVSFYNNYKLYTFCIPYEKVIQKNKKNKYKPHLIGVFDNHGNDITSKLVKFQGPNYDFFKNLNFSPSLKNIFDETYLNTIHSIEIILNNLEEIRINITDDTKEKDINEILEKKQ